MTSNLIILMQFIAHFYFLICCWRADSTIDAQIWVSERNIDFSLIDSFFNLFKKYPKKTTILTIDDDVYEPNTLFHCKYSFGKYSILQYINKDDGQKYWTTVNPKYYKTEGVCNE